MGLKVGKRLSFTLCNARLGPWFRALCILRTRVMSHMCMAAFCVTLPVVSEHSSVGCFDDLHFIKLHCCAMQAQQADQTRQSMQLAAQQPAGHQCKPLLDCADAALPSALQQIAAASNSATVDHDQGSSLVSRTSCMHSRADQLLKAGAPGMVLLASFFHQQIV